MTAREDILEYVSDKENCPQNWLYEEVDVSRGRISQVLKEMEEEGLISREKKGREKWIKLKSKGKDELNRILKDRVNSTSPTESTPKQSGLPGRDDGASAIDFHKNVIRARIENLEQLREKYSDSYGDRWNIQYLERESIKYQENKYNNAVNFYEDGYEVILTQNYAFIRLEDMRSSPGDLYRNFQKLMVKGREAVKWLEENLQEVEMDWNSIEPCFAINEGHTAIVEETLAQLIAEHPDADLNRFKIFIDGELRLWVDYSDGEPHLEARTDGQGIEDLHFIFNELYRSFIDNKDGWRQVMELAESEKDVSRLPEKIEQVEGAVEQLSESVQKVATNVTQVLEANNGLSSGSETVSGEQMESTQVVEKLDKVVQAIETGNAIFSSSDQRVVEKLEKLEELENISIRLQSVEEAIQENSISSSVGQAIEEGEAREIESLRPEVPHNAELEKIQIQTGGMERPETLADKELEVDPGALEKGFRFQDLREDILLEIQGFELEELPQGFQDVAVIRKAGTLKVWNRIPRVELARLLGTGRFEARDKVSR